MNMTVQRIGFVLVMALFAILPWHSFLISGFVGSVFPAVGVWKDIVLVCLLAIGLLTNATRLRRDQLVMGALVAGVVTYYGCLAVWSSSVPALYGFRYNTLPYVALLAGLLLSLDSVQYRHLVHVVIIGAVAALIFGVVQSVIFGSELLLRAGYPPGGGDGRPLRFSFYVGGGSIQRLCAGFSGPLAFALYSLFIFVFSLAALPRTARLARRLLPVVSALSLFGSLSRSALAAAALIFVVYRREGALRRIVLGTGIAIFMGGIFVAGVAAGQPWFLMVLDHAGATVTGTDPSLRAHFAWLETGLEEVVASLPFGIGLGLVGPQATAYTDHAIVPESSFMALLLDGGLPGLLLAAAVFVSLLRISRGMFVRAMLAALVVMGIFLPIQYYSEPVIMIALMIGLVVRRERDRRLISALGREG